MKVLMVLEGEFPPDERVEKEIKSLQDLGFTIVLACYTFTNRPDKVTHHRYIIRRKPISRLIYKSSAACLILPLYFRYWYSYLDTLLHEERFDCIHIHDLPLSKVGYDLSRKYKLKLVCDQHEFYSNWIVRTRHYNTGLGKLIRFLSNWDKYEDKYLRKADMVITVEESLRKLYIEKLQIDPSKIVTLPNTPQSQVFNPTNIDPSILDKYKSRFVLFYGGSLDHLRGLDFIAQAVAELKNDIDSLLFLVAGKENKTFSMQELIMKYGIGEVTDYVGWVPLAKLPSYVSASRICLFVPIADNLEINNTVATKIYQYAAMGKPVIVSEARLMRKFVEENRIGFSVNFGDIHGFCEIVRTIYRNPEICSDIKQRAMEVAGHYTWENTSRLFTRFYTHLTS